MIIFDWDGTLCDSAGHIVRAMQEAASEAGLGVPEDEDVRNIIGLGLPQGIALLFPDVALSVRDDIASAYSRHYIAAEDSPPELFHGALETLDTMRSRGVGLAVATGKSRRGLDRILSLYGLEHYFETTRCADETRSKPHPQMIAEILHERGVPAHRALMVGDTEYDLEMATNAGIASAGVSFGVHSRKRLCAHSPVAIVDTLPELLDLPFIAEL